MLDEIALHTALKKRPQYLPSRERIQKMGFGFLMGVYLLLLGDFMHSMCNFPYPAQHFFYESKKFMSMEEETHIPIANTKTQGRHNALFSN